MGRFDGKVVAITGAARGIGLQTAKAFVAEGATVAVCDIDEEALNAALDEVEVAAWVTDVTQPSALRNFLDEVEAEFGELDVVVNNAGIMRTGPLVEESDQVSIKAIEINLNAVVIGTKRALESMLPRGQGVIVNIASVAGEAGIPGLATYCGSKFGVLGFTLATRAEVADKGVEVVAVLPSFVNTELASGTGDLRFFPPLEVTDIASGILDAAAGGAPARMHLPRSIAPVLMLGQVLPEAVSSRVMSFLGADRVMLDTDKEARASYEDRIDHG